MALCRTSESWSIASEPQRNGLDVCCLTEQHCTEVQRHKDNVSASDLNYTHTHTHTNWPKQEVPNNCHSLTHRTSVGVVMETNVPHHTWEKAWLDVPLTLRSNCHHPDCVCTWYDFWGLDLHKALVCESVSEELADSRLQPEDGLAGGGLQEESDGRTSTDTNISTINLIQQITCCSDVGLVCRKTGWRGMSWYRTPHYDWGTLNQRKQQL